ncbi:MAG: SprT family zinc-dependent metalloprotease [Calditrichaeota bacterium]|nr:SprT family zinc-dependent metalloprotease [Calditrichota bacterium]
MRRSLEQLDLFVHAPPSTGVEKKRPATTYGKARGQVYDLDEFFRILNERYLWNRLTRPVLRWSRNRWRIVLGICDVERGVITLNRALDDSRVPDIVVASTLFHEMLHLHFGIEEDANGRRRVHPPEFKRAEKGLPGYHEAEIWIKKCFPLRGRPAKKPRETMARFLSLHASSASPTGTGSKPAGMNK